MSSRASLLAERALFGTGLAFVSAWLVIAAYGTIASSLALRQFDRAVEASSRDSQAADRFTNDQPEFSLWDPTRIAAYKQSLIGWKTAPLAVMRMERLGMRVPIFEGTGDAQLNRGAGWIEGTARPADHGNIGVAGHRDGFFRPLKDAKVGDRIELQTTQTTTLYVVDEIAIVTPQDVHVLQPRARPSLTLVTCYPFYFVGSAPQRYIVHASVVDRAQSDVINAHVGVLAVRNPEDRK
jgi:sortase A